MFDALRRCLFALLGPHDWGRPFRVAVLSIGLLTIVAWQRSFFVPAETGTTPVELDQRYIITASRGVQSEAKFYFFLRHLGLYPVMSLSPLQADSAEEAQRHFREQAKDLRMDEALTFRSGDRGRTYLYFVSTWFNGAAVAPSLIPAAFMGFTLALCALFASCWAVRRTPMGVGLVALLGSNPFQLVEVYQHENVFSWPITSAIFLLALHVPLMEKRPRRVLFFLVPVVAAVWLSTIRTVRSEGAAMMLTVLVVYATAARIRWTDKVAGILLFLTITTGVSRLYDRAILRRFEQTQAAVRAAGGTAFAGPVVLYHEIWPAVWGGLGDFDTAHGYRWDDRTTYAYALPQMKTNYGVVVPHWDPSNWHFDMDDDYHRIYPYFFLEAPHYEDALRDKLLFDIRNEPAWYLDIIRQRLWRIFTEATPLTLTTRTLQLESSSPFVALGCVPLMLFLLLTRKWTYAKLLAFTIPLTTTALIIYSGGGTPNYNCFHLVGACIFVALVLEGVRGWLLASSTATETAA